MCARKADSTTNGSEHTQQNRKFLPLDCSSDSERASSGNSRLTCEYAFGPSFGKQAGQISKTKSSTPKPSPAMNSIAKPILAQSEQPQEQDGYNPLVRTRES